MSFSLFNSKHQKRVTLEEGEAPPKKIFSEGDALIKRLAEKQLETKVTLKGQLHCKKEFQHGEEFNTYLTTSNSGTNSLNSFQSYVNIVNHRYELKKVSHLTDEDIDLHFEYKKSNNLEEFLKKYKNVNSSILEKRIKNIEIIIENSSKVESNLRCENNIFSRSKIDYLNSIKSDSTETKLLKFALKNESLSKHKIKLPHPMDEISGLEKDFSESIELFTGTNLDPRKIQKKARNLSKRISDLEESALENAEPKKLLNTSKESLWDVREKVPDNKIKTKVINKEKKVYTCEKQNLYTIKNGEIVKISSAAVDKNVGNDQQIKQKLTLEEIKNIPKFVSYTEGEPSETLYLKNLPNSVNKESLEKILDNFLKTKEVSVKVMSGKMKGQGFLEFKSIEDAKEILDAINGLFIDNKPVIVQFGKKKKEIKP